MIAAPISAHSTVPHKSVAASGAGSQPDAGRQKLSKVEPWAWLYAVLKELPICMTGADGKFDQPPDLTDLLPDNWLNSHPEHRWQIDDIRKEERARSRQQKISNRRPQGR